GFRATVALMAAHTGAALSSAVLDSPADMTAVLGDDGNRKVRQAVIEDAAVESRGTRTTHYARAEIPEGLLDFGFAQIDEVSGRCVRNRISRRKGRQKVHAHDQGKGSEFPTHFLLLQLCYCSTVYNRSEEHTSELQS